MKAAPLSLREETELRARPPRYPVHIWSYAEDIARLLATLDAARATQPCGHPTSLLVRSVESSDTHCELCDLRAQLTDALTMEVRHRGERDAARAEIAALRKPSPATTPEPAPTGDGEEVLPVVLEAARRAGVGVELSADLEARAAFGEAKYGTPLRAWNGRDAAVDAYQEALDLVMYLTQCAGRGMEGRPRSERVARLVARAFKLADDVRRIVGEVPATQAVPVVTFPKPDSLCRTCKGERLVRNTHTPRLDDPEWWPCPDCSESNGGAK
jgi:hypothetical protein